MAQKERISVNVDASEREQLERLAEDNDVSLAWLTRRALRSYLAAPLAPGDPRSPGSAVGDGSRVRPSTLGWKEWVSLPNIGVAAIRAKVDTGARTSALNAQAIEPFEREGRNWVRFTLRPDRRRNREIDCEAPVTEVRTVKDSGGHAEDRYVIETPVRLGASEDTWLIEITLANRSGMQFAMLLGRTAVRRRFAVDPARSFVAGVPAAAHHSARRSAP